MRKLIGMVVALAALPGAVRAQERRPERQDGDEPSREEVRWRVPAMGRMRFREFEGPRFRDRMFQDRMFRIRDRMAFRGRDFRMAPMHIRVPRMNMRIPEMNFRAPRIRMRLPEMDIRTPRMDMRMPEMRFDTPRVRVRVPRMHIQVPEMRMRTPGMRWRPERYEGDDDEDRDAGSDDDHRPHEEMMAMRDGMLRMRHSRYRPI